MQALNPIEFGSKHLSVELNIFKPQQNETYVAVIYHHYGAISLSP